MAAAPTPDAIIAAGASFCVHCRHCREVRVPANLAQRLIAAGKGRTPIDQLVFRCEICGEAGEPVVDAPGNLTMGRPRLWPPDPPPLAGEGDRPQDGGGGAAT